MTTRTLDLTPDGVLVASQTDVGQVRAANEDSCAITRRADGARLLVVADGMGGHRGGATASQTAATLICETFKEDLSTGIADLLRGSIQTANAQIYEQSTLDPELEGMGTTVVALAIDADLRGFVAHVGDSRAYRARNGRLEALTSDHSVVAEMEKRGLLTPEEAAHHPRRNEILRSVGVLPQVEVDSAEVDVRAGDRFLLCSDGLTGPVQDAEIAEILRSKKPEGAVAALVDRANERGGVDNITAQILAIPEVSANDEHAQPAEPLRPASSAAAPGPTASQAPRPNPPEQPVSPPRHRFRTAALVFACALLAYYFVH